MSAREPASVETNRLLAALAYPVWLAVALFIVLTSPRRDTSLRQHGWTALCWSLAWAVLLSAVMTLGHVGVLGWVMIVAIAPPLLAVWLVLSIYYALRAYNGKEVSIPVVSDLARKYAK